VKAKRRILLVGRRALASVGVAVLVCVAVGFENHATASPATTLTVGVLAEPPTLNPLAPASTETHDITDLLFLKLLDEQGDFIGFGPRLAREWHFGADSLSITFELRDDVRWSDGAPVTARDVRFTWELETDTLVAWPSRSLKQRIRDVEVVDDRTVTFHFTERYPYQLMDANDGVILPSHLLAGVPRDQLRTHEFGRRPVGDGPYRLARWEPGQYIELEANDDYYEGSPVVDRVVFKFVADMVTLMTQLKKGEIDLLESVPYDQQRELLEGYPDIEIYRYPSRRIDFISWNLTRELFSGADVRRALTMAINRQELIETVWGGNAVECTSPIPSVLWAYDDSIRPIPFDPDRAREILAGLGWKDTDDDGVLDKDGAPFEFELITNQGNQQRVDVCTMVESYLRRIGVEANIRTMEFGTFIGKVRAGDYDACVLQLKMGTKPDITNTWHSSSVPPNGTNVSFYRNAEVDSLIEQARATIDPEVARPLWSRVQRIIYHDQPFTFIAIPDEVNALDGRFCNVQPNAISFFANLRYWRVEPDCAE
jgi:peptide/nickel transport system substrate-binding protein